MAIEFWLREEQPKPVYLVFCCWAMVWWIWGADDMIGVVEEGEGGMKVRGAE